MRSEKLFFRGKKGKEKKASLFFRARRRSGGEENKGSLFSLIISPRGEKKKEKLRVRSQSATTAGD